LLRRPNSAAEATPGQPIEFLGIVGSEDLAEHFQKFEGSGDGGSETAGEEQSGDAGQKRVASVEEINSGVEGGEDHQPVSTSGEKQAEEPDTTSEIATSDEVILDFSFTEGDALFLTPDVPFLLPTGGSVFATGLGFFGFDAITQGSLIGSTIEGDTIRIPVAETVLDFTTTINGSSAPSFFAQSRFENSGFVEFGPGDGATSAFLGDLTGHGFSDLDNGFHLYTFESDGSSGQIEEGIILFGTATPGQAADFPGDNGSIAADANTVSVFRIEPDLGSSGGNDGPPGELLLIGNGGEARFDHPDTALEPGSGGRVAVAEVVFDIEPELGQQFSEFTAFAAPIESFGSGGPRIGGTAVSTDSFGSDVFVVETNVGTFEDADGNTVFGPDADYLVLSSLHRPDGVGGLTFDPGTEHILGGPDVALDPFLNLATRDPGADRIVNNPLPLANEPLSRISALGTLDSVFATGIAKCSTGNCGGGGLYALSSVNPVNGSLANFTFSDGGSGADTNGLSFAFDLLNSNEDANIAGGPLQFTLESSAPVEATSAYVNDREFVLTTDRQQNIAGQQGDALVALASSGLAGTGGLTSGASPEFLRWGWWSASLTPTEAGVGPREDVVHLGTWIAGVQPDPNDVPFSGLGAYEGLAVGVEADLNGGSTRRIGGDFALSYDFGANIGDFDLNIAGHNFTAVTVSGAGGNGSPLGYAGFATVAGADLAVDGGFNSGGGSAIAATSGQFQITDTTRSQQVIGVFGGDLQSFDPSGGSSTGGGNGGPPLQP